MIGGSLSDDGDCAVARLAVPSGPGGEVIVPGRSLKEWEEVCVDRSQRLKSLQQPPATRRGRRK